MQTYTHFTLNNTQVRCNNTSTSFLELYNTSTHTWEPMNKELSQNVVGKKRKYPSNGEYAQQHKKQKLSFDSLYTDLVLHILSFRPYYVIDNFLASLKIEVKELFGRFKDASIHTLYPNVKLFDDNLCSMPPDWIKKCDGDQTIVLHDAKQIDLDCQIDPYTLSNIHLISPSLQTLIIRYYIRHSGMFVLDRTKYDFSHIYDKIQYFSCEGEEYNIDQILLMKHLKTLRLNELKITKNELIQLISSVKCSFIGFYDMEITQPSITTPIENTEQPEFPLNAVNNNPYIEQLELYDSEFRVYNINAEYLKHSKLKTLKCRLHTNHLAVLSENEHSRNITLYGVNREEIDYLKQMKNLETIELYVSKRDITKLAMVAELNNIAIEIIRWEDEEEPEDLLSDTNKFSLTAQELSQMISAFQHSTINVVAGDDSF
jgi:hypothetical protein